LLTGFIRSLLFEVAAVRSLLRLWSSLLLALVALLAATFRAPRRANRTDGIASL